MKITIKQMKEGLVELGIDPIWVDSITERDVVDLYEANWQEIQRIKEEKEKSMEIAWAIDNEGRPMKKDPITNGDIFDLHIELNQKADVLDIIENI